MKILLRAAALALAPVLLAGTAASAQMMGAAPQAAPPVGVRGTVTSVAGTADTGMKIGVTGTASGSTGVTGSSGVTGEMLVGSESTGLGE